MTFINRLIDGLNQAAARRREQHYVSGVLLGPDTAFRSELIDAMSSRPTFRV